MLQSRQLPGRPTPRHGEIPPQASLRRALCQGVSNITAEPPEAQTGGRTYQLPDALIREALWEGGLHWLHSKAQLAVLELLQLVQGGAEVVVGLARDVQVTQREVQPANKQATHVPSWGKAWPLPTARLPAASNVAHAAGWESASASCVFSL